MAHFYEPPPPFPSDDPPPFTPKDDPPNAAPQSRAAPITPPTTAYDPPAYTAFDDQANIFSLRGSIIYACHVSDIPRYQLSLLRTKSGKPYQLRIRRLLGFESRRLSLALTPVSSHASSSTSPTSPASPAGKARRQSSICDYDHDATMYEIKNVSSLGGWSSSGNIEIRGCRASTLPGIISLDKKASGVLGRGQWKFWHLTRNAAADSLKEENEQRMQKYGYHADKEWNRELLLCAKGSKKGFEWLGGGGKTLASEEVMGGSSLKMQAEVNGVMRDLLVTCWAARCWSSDTLTGEW